MWRDWNMHADITHPSMSTPSWATYSQLRDQFPVWSLADVHWVTI